MATTTQGEAAMTTILFTEQKAFNNAFDRSVAREIIASCDAPNIIEMGFSDGWTAPDGVKAPDSKRYAACGDAIVTTVAFWIADRIRMIEEEEEA